MFYKIIAKNEPSYTCNGVSYPVNTIMAVYSRHLANFLTYGCLVIEMIESDKYTTLVLSKLRDSVFVVSHFREHLHGFILISRAKQMSANILTSSFEISHGT